MRVIANGAVRVKTRQRGVSHARNMRLRFVFSGVGRRGGGGLAALAKDLDFFGGFLQRVEGEQGGFLFLNRGRVRGLHFLQKLQHTRLSRPDRRRNLGAAGAAAAAAGAEVAAWTMTGRAIAP